jgi:hypothetical protein
MGFVRKVGRAFDDAIIQPVVNTVEKIAENPVLLAGLAIGIPAIGGLIGAGGAAAAAGELAASELLASELGADIAGGLLSSGAGGAGVAEGLSALDAGLGAYGSGTGLLSGAEGLSALDAGMGAYPTTGDIGLSGLDAGMGAYPSTGNIEPSALDAGMGDYPSTGTIGAEPTTPSLIDKAKEAASKLTVSDALRAAGLVGSVVGAGKIADSLGSGGSSGSGAFDIVPIPSDWKSPPPTGVAEFTPLAPIDFGNKEMLRGTQWEKLLSPDYGKAPVMPPMPVNPSNMSYDELTRILGGSRTSVPTQSLSINDVIAGIQSQYGQTPQGSMGQKPA